MTRDEHNHSMARWTPVCSESMSLDIMTVLQVLAHLRLARIAKRIVRGIE